MLTSGGCEVFWERLLCTQAGTPARMPQVRRPHQDMGGIPGASQLPTLRGSRPSCHCPAQPGSTAAPSEAPKKWVTETAREI